MFFMCFTALSFHKPNQLSAVDHEPGFSLRILVAGERCNVTGEYFERRSE